MSVLPQSNMLSGAATPRTSTHLEAIYNQQVILADRLSSVRERLEEKAKALTGFMYPPKKEEEAQPYRFPSSSPLNQLTQIGDSWAYQIDMLELVVSELERI